MKLIKEDIDIFLITGGDYENKSVAENTNKLINVLLNVTPNIYLVTFCNSNLIYSLDRNKISSLKNYDNRFKQFLYSQMLISKELILKSQTGNLKTVLFAFGSDLQILPLILAKLVARKTIIRSDGRPTVILKKYLKKNWSLKRFFFGILEEVNYNLADLVLTECKYMVNENNFQKYNYEVGKLFVNVNQFKPKLPIIYRRYDIGYIGRFNNEKGVLNFVKAIPNILTEFVDLKFLIGGDGELRKEIEKYVYEQNLSDSGEFIGWISHNDLPNCLNGLKLLIVPSEREGLPNIILESMACGTPVLAVPVGGIPGLIIDEETGFIMENNSPSCIAKNVIRALEHPYLEKIADNARKLVEQEFSYETTVNNWNTLLRDLG